MTKEEYAKLFAELTQQEIQVNKNKAELYKNYISEHKNFSRGDRVKITYTHRWNDASETAECFIGECNCHDDGTIFYSYYKVSQKGVMSKHRFRPEYRGDVTIELIEAAKEKEPS